MTISEKVFFWPDVGSRIRLHLAPKCTPSACCCFRSERADTTMRSLMNKANLRVHVHACVDAHACTWDVGELGRCVGGFTRSFMYACVRAQCGHATMQECSHAPADKYARARTHSLHACLRACLCTCVPLCLPAPIHVHGVHLYTCMAYDDPRSAGNVKTI